MVPAPNARTRQEEEVRAIAESEGVDEEHVSLLFGEVLTDLGSRTRVPDYLPLIAGKRVRATLRASRLKKGET